MLSFLRPKQYKYCFHCRGEKLISEFHKDAGRKDGLSALCAKCRNAASARIKKQKAEKTKKLPRNTQVLPKKGVSIPILPTDSHYFEEVSDKFDCCFSLTVQADKKAFLHVHSTPPLSFKGSTWEEACQTALAADTPASPPDPQTAGA